MCMVLICMLLGIYYSIISVSCRRQEDCWFRFDRSSGVASPAQSARRTYESDRLMSTASSSRSASTCIFLLPFRARNILIKRFCGFCYHLFTQSPPYNRRRKKQMTMTGQNGAKIGTDTVKQGLAQMLKGGVIVRLTTN